VSELFVVAFLCSVLLLPPIGGSAENVHGPSSSVISIKICEHKNSCFFKNPEQNDQLNGQEKGQQLP
jgi:hypothetical protein